jgi:hypothetical protein
MSQNLNKSSLSPAKNTGKISRNDILQLEYSNLNMNHVDMESFDQDKTLEQQKVINELRVMVGEI